MHSDILREMVLSELTHIAPEASAALNSEIPIRDQIDFDSIDHMNFLIALHDKLGVDIPERDYPKLASIDDCVDYIGEKFS